ncbi:hypothetical protein MPF_0475 [Methanohalophilus portucalensis FDF-1]|uniref:Uncharacterized protein n=1 Tax=Methanohalophilus portucalensis FDF-1 TaxID=523843 RepID=A0A1L9C5A1_9EURY|nr:hypothetical protein MPF_0475 [Methanohalophilus portucalensis FDF-1]
MYTVVDLLLDKKHREYCFYYEENKIPLTYNKEIKRFFTHIIGN